MLTDENLIQSRKDIYNDYLLIDVDEIDSTERTIWDFFSLYEDEGKDSIYEYYPNITLKQSQ